MNRNKYINIYVNQVYGWKERNDIIYQKYFSQLSYEDLDIVNENIRYIEVPKEVQYLTSYKCDEDKELISDYLKYSPKISILRFLFKQYFSEDGLPNLFIITIFSTFIGILIFMISVASTMIVDHWNNCIIIIIYTFITIMSGFLSVRLYKYLKEIKCIESIFLYCSDYFNSYLIILEEANEKSNDQVIKHVIETLDIDGNLYKEFINIYKESDNTEQKQINLYFTDIYNILQKDKYNKLELDFTSLSKSLQDYMSNIIYNQKKDLKTKEQLNVEIISQCLRNEIQ